MNRSPLSIAIHGWSKTCLSVCGLLLAPVACHADNPPWSAYPTGSALAVSVPDGRIVRGVIDPRTTDEHLWLTGEVEGMRVGSRLAIADVVRVDSAKPVSLPQRRAHAAPARGGERTVPDMTIAESSPPSQPESSQHRTAQSLAAIAYLENWDDDSEIDGLRLHLSPRDSRGELTPASGSLSVHLAVYRGDWRDQKGRFEQEEHWSQEISADDYGPLGAQVDLPFRRTSPETDPEVLAVGVLRVRFNIAGEGKIGRAHV